MSWEFLKPHHKGNFGASFCWEIGLKGAGKGEAKVRRWEWENRGRLPSGCQGDACNPMVAGGGVIINPLCFSFQPCWDGNFRHAREEDSGGEADEGHDGLGQEVQLPHQHVGCFRSSGNLLQEVQLRLGTTSALQATAPQAEERSWP